MKKILFLFVAPALFAASPQYQSGEIIVPAASAEETVLKQFSLEKADQYLEQGAAAWTRKRDVSLATQPVHTCRFALN